MWNNVFGRRIRRSNRRQLFAGLALCLGVAALVFLARRYLYNVLLGPFPIDPATLAALDRPDERLEYFVTVRKGEVEVLFPRSYTGGQEPYSVYALLPAADKKLLLRLATGHQGQHVSGTLEE